MTHQFRLGAAALVLALGAGAAVFASTQNTAGRPGPFIGGRPPFAHFAGRGGPLAAFGMRMMASRLGLTDAQKEQMKGIAQAHRDEWKAMAQRAVAARQALHEAIAADTIDEAAIRQRSAAVASVEADMAVARAHARADMFKVLTPEQQAQVKTMQSQMKERIGRLMDRLR